MEGWAASLDTGNVSAFPATSPSLPRGLLTEDGTGGSGVTFPVAWRFPDKMYLDMSTLGGKGRRSERQSPHRPQRAACSPTASFMGQSAYSLPSLWPLLSLGRETRKVGGLKPSKKNVQQLVRGKKNENDYHIPEP